MRRVMAGPMGLTASTANRSVQGAVAHRTEGIPHATGLAWRFLILWMGASVCHAQSNIAAEPNPSATGRHNILLIIADDMGVDKVAAYGEHPDPPPTPTIDSLAERGVLFRHAYANPKCSPTRATLLTGRYGFRYDLGEAILVHLPNQPALPYDEISIPEMLDRGTGNIYAHSAVGKWHLGSLDVGNAKNPLQHGFAHFSGILGNFSGDDQDYYSWTKTVNGRQHRSLVYATTDQVDDAIERIKAMPQPWFLWLAFSAAHFPLHQPPENLHTYDLSGSPDATPVPHFNAAVQALDTELGRMFDSIEAAVLANTVIIFVGDNGTPRKATAQPFNRHRAKGTVYEGGVNVPLIVAGPLIRKPGTECAALVNTTDVFATVADIAGVDLSTTLPDDRRLDSVSMLPYLIDPSLPSIRPWVFSERFQPNGTGDRDEYRRMIRDERWKLIERDVFGAPQPDEFYDLERRFKEGPDLLLGEMTETQKNAYQRLKRAMGTLLRTQLDSDVAP